MSTIYKQINDIADEASYEIKGNSISCNFETKIKMFRLFAETNNPMPLNAKYNLLGSFHG
jgi:hypothetical protein